MGGGLALGCAPRLRHRMQVLGTACTGHLQSDHDVRTPQQHIHEGQGLTHDALIDLAE